MVTLATYGYFAFSLIGRQALIIRSDPLTGKPINDDINLYFPLFTTLEFLFYIGWLKVGEELRCPFGEDDDDFDMNFILDRNIHVSNLITHVMPGKAPTVGPSPIWDGVDYPTIPHTFASWHAKQPIPNWRLGNVKFKESEIRPWSSDASGRATGGGSLFAALTDKNVLRHRHTQPKPQTQSSLLPHHNPPVKQDQTLQKVTVEERPTGLGSAKLKTVEVEAPVNVRMGSAVSNRTVSLPSENPPFRLGTTASSRGAGGADETPHRQKSFIDSDETRLTQSEF